MKKKTQVDARSKILEYLAARDHSEKELREKLGRRYTPEEINDALESARSANLLPEPEVLAKQVAGTLSRKKKSHRYIQEFLKKKGLPAVDKETDTEIEKARELIIQKFRKGPPFTFEEKPKVHRYLAYRGFDQDTIRRVMHERE